MTDYGACSNDPKFYVRLGLRNSADSDQTAQEKSDQGLHYLKYIMHLLES